MIPKCYLCFLPQDAFCSKILREQSLFLMASKGCPRRIPGHFVHISLLFGLEQTNNFLPVVFGSDLSFLTCSMCVYSKLVQYRNCRN